jgi:hypothetical protein
MHLIGVRVGDEHVARLHALAEASGFTHGEIVRRALLSAEIPSARARQEVQDLLRIQREQNRLGGLLKKALTEREEKAELRRTPMEVERNGAEFRRVLRTTSVVSGNTNGVRIYCIGNGVGLERCG